MDDSQLQKFSQVTWNQFSAVVLSLNQELALDSTVLSLANDMLPFVECDRVSVVVIRNGRNRVMAVSGHDTVNRRSDVVRTLENLCERIGPEVFVFDGTKPDDGVPPHLEGELARYLELSQLRYLRIHPLLVGAEYAQELKGHIVAECADPAGKRMHMERRCRLLVPHAANAIGAAIEHESIFLNSFWKKVGRTAGWLRAKHKRVVFFTMVALLILGIVSVKIQVPYRVRVSGHIRPQQRHSIFAPVDGDVDEISIQDGSHVKAGETLFLLSSAELETRAVVLRHEIEEKEKLVRALRARLELTGRDRDAAISAESEYVREKLSLDSSKKMLEVISKEQQSLNIVSPDEGIVVTFDLDRRLRGRPVNRGELLAEIMNPDGPWMLEIKIPDYRMGHVLTDANPLPGEQIEVSFVTANDVQSRITGTIVTIGTRTESTTTDGTYVRGLVAFESSELSARLIGAEATARIRCGDCTLLYALFGDLYEYILRHWW